MSCLQCTPIILACRKGANWSQVWELRVITKMLQLQEDSFEILFLNAALLMNSWHVKATSWLLLPWCIGFVFALMDIFTAKSLFSTIRTSMQASYTKTVIMERHYNCKNMVPSTNIIAQSYSQRIKLLPVFSSLPLRSAWSGIWWAPSWPRITTDSYKCC